MKRIILLALATGVAAVTAPAASAQLPAGDSVTGSGTAGMTRADTFAFQIDAHSGPSGENPTGAAQITPGEIGQPFGGPITCLAVSRNVATFNFEAPPGSTGVETFVATDSPTGDQIAFVGPGRAPTDCSPVTNPPNQPLNGGDIVVVDAQPLPTSKRQCKGEGWRSYGVFKNQGDCVSFVRRQARQECNFIRVAHGRPAFRAEYGGGIHERHAMRRCVRERMND
jgi:hypothetical protein